MTAASSARSPLVARLEIAHFWQDVCLSIAVYPAGPSGSVPESWIDAVDTRIRLRSVEPVDAIPREWGVAGWSPFLVLFFSILGTALLSSQDREDSSPALRIATILRAVGDPPCTRGDVFVVTNGMPWASIYVDCSDPTVRTGRVLAPGQSLRASPDAVASCRFSEGGYSWSYPFAVSHASIVRQRHRASCTDLCGPYLFVLEINAERTLVSGYGESARFDRIPMRPYFHDR